MPINISFFGNQTINVSDLSNAGAYGVCVKEDWSPNMLIFSFLNVATIIVMLFLIKKGKPEKADRLVNIMFLFNLFALVMNIVIALGLKFLPV